MPCLAAKRRSPLDGTHECRRQAFRRRLSKSSAPFAPVDGTWIVGHHFNLFHVHADFDAYWSGFELPPYIGIKSRPKLSRQRAYPEWITRRYRLPPALFSACWRSLSPVKKSDGRSLAIDARYAEMRRGSSDASNVMTGPADGVRRSGG